MDEGSIAQKGGGHSEQNWSATNLKKFLIIVPGLSLTLVTVVPGEVMDADTDVVVGFRANVATLLTKATD
jgi:hypothetical protein